MSDFPLGDASSHEAEPVAPQTNEELFIDKLEGLNLLTDAQLEGRFRTLGFLAASSALTGMEFGINDEVHGIYRALHRSAGRTYVEDPQIADRLLGILDMYSQVVTMMPQQISDREYEFLSKIQDNQGEIEIDDLPDLNESDDQVESVEHPEGINVHSVGTGNPNFRVRWLGQKGIVNLTPRGGMAIEAYKKRKAKETTSLA